MTMNVSRREARECDRNLPHERDLSNVILICICAFRSGIVKRRQFAPFFPLSTFLYYRSAVPNLGYVRNLKWNANLRFKQDYRWKCTKKPSPNSPVGMQVFFCLLVGTRAVKGWEPLLQMTMRDIGDEHNNSFDYVERIFHLCHTNNKTFFIKEVGR